MRTLKDFSITNKINRRKFDIKFIIFNFCVSCYLSSRSYVIEI